ncbi:MAG: ribulose-phosphate 3-epimerase [SAR202 cluster bacterium]|nr:ribulose-phosphate 3-epimerase [SAR202 cluster bacterium]MQG26707.1 ribulose-phosphate 3-epimerase [SAR202 cluster bacterium]MQG35151.1 ribulose-phosphate 3-epimerase [SAR202 cluster bacterium]MQG53155.1 ribulose-phosphate 3-epimerase [SAR202 cluster bacterium]MQG85612.1 ribulose-phosphate 3-epimerase [SAR202 cluster bacterium]|tara:strand:- start:2761 stop:3435 length:675 start_codon:yes stop_codon:yes gene_type:complete
MNCNHIQIAPSLLTADFGHLVDEVKLAEDGGADLLHLDVMDGQFVPNISFGSLVIDSIRNATSLPLNIHLMIEEPDRFLEDFIKSDTDQIIVHAEACAHLDRTVSRIKDLGAAVGVALNPSTPLSAIEDVADMLDIIMIMTVNPGFGGQSFIDRMIDKIERADSLIKSKGLKAKIEVDGGIKADHTASDCVKAGAEILVAGSAVYNKEDTVKNSIAKLRGALEG